MKKSIRPILTIAIVLFSKLLIAQTVTINGNIFLENQTLHDSIVVLFQRVAPSAYTDSVLTDGSGHFTISIPTGFYDYSFNRIGYLGVSLTGKPLYANTTLTDTTLEFIGLHGNIKGILAANTYKVSENLIVQSSDTLIISPGTILKFKGNLSILVKGLLLAEGNANDSIVFTSFNTLRWAGVKFYNSNPNSIMSHCLVEKSDSAGITIYNSSPLISNTTIKNNSNRYNGGAPPPYYGGGGVFLSNSNSILDGVIISDNSSTFGAGVFSHLGHPIIKNAIIKHNRAGLGPGGILLDVNSSLSVFDTYIFDSYTNNSPTIASSGGISALGNSNLYINNCVIANNMGSGISGANMYITNTTIANNKYSGIELYSTSNLFVSNCIVVNNKICGLASNQMSTGNIDISNSNIYNNHLGNFCN